MLQRLIIKNFKGIKDRTEVELRPITLLFGANGSGKSSILHAIHLMKRTLVDGDCFATGIGRSNESGINLGDFSQFVHGHDTSTKVTLGMVVAEPTVSTTYTHMVWDITNFGNLGAAIAKRIHTFQMEWDLASSGITEVRIELNDEPFVDIQQNSYPPTIHFHRNHPLLNAPSNFDADGAKHLGAVLKQLAKTATMQEGSDPNKYVINIQLDKILLPQALFGRQQNGVPKYRLAGQVSGIQFNREQQGEFDDFLTATILMPIVYAGEMVHESQFLGPLRTRTIPERVEQDSDGTRAWKRGSSNLALVNEILSNKNFLDFPFEVRRSTSFSITLESDDQSDYYLSELRSILEGESTLSQADQISHFSAFNRAKIRHRLCVFDKRSKTEVDLDKIPTGASQIIPVLLAVFEAADPGTEFPFDSTNIISIEQPELHLHPKAQLAIADAIILSHNHYKYEGLRRVLLETHSEHILLRLLRRIRMTSEGKLTEDSLLRFTPEDLSVVYVEKMEATSPDEPPTTRALRLRVDERGEFIDRWPQGFFEERGEELFG
jgi:predicted ATPase